MRARQFEVVNPDLVFCSPRVAALFRLVDSERRPRFVCPICLIGIAFAETWSETKSQASCD